MVVFESVFLWFFCSTAVHAKSYTRAIEGYGDKCKFTSADGRFVYYFTHSQWIVSVCPMLLRFTMVLTSGHALMIPVGKWEYLGDTADGRPYYGGVLSAKVVFGIEIPTVDVYIYYDR